MSETMLVHRHSEFRLLELELIELYMGLTRSEGGLEQFTGAIESPISHDFQTVDGEKVT